MNRFWDDVSAGYTRHIVDAGKEFQVMILVSFLVTFAIVRIITHAIRRGDGHIHNVETAGGLHIHHLVPGILLLLLSGYLGIGLGDEIAVWPVAILFGIGAALTLDEFALWLHLEDVYWAKEGRDSIDAVIIAATLAGIAILGNAFLLDLFRALRRLITG